MLLAHQKGELNKIAGIPVTGEARIMPSYRFLLYAALKRKV